MNGLPQRRTPRASDAGIDAQVTENIGRLRQEKGWSQRELAKRMCEVGEDHWRQTTVSRVEKGTQGLTTRELRALVTLLGPGVTAGSQLTRVLENAGREAIELRARQVRGELREVVKAQEQLLQQTRDVLADLDDWLDDAPK